MLIDELKIIIALSGNKRLHHLEEEIFTNNALSDYYLHNLCKHFNAHWYNEYDCGPMLAYYYARYILKDRWHVAEQFIASNHESGYSYAVFIIKDRFPLAELVISRNPEFAWRYASVVIKGSWTIAEPAIFCRPEFKMAYERMLDNIRNADTSQ